MKFLITGLGNPGAEYMNNRHNIGFMVLDSMAQAKEKEFESARYGYTLKLRFKGRQLLLLKPTTFMNLSGKAVRYWLEKEKIAVSNLLVVTDDIALPFGKLRMKPKGSDGGHNGLKSIIEILGSQQFPRLRFGVGDDFGRGQQADYVLSDFNAEEEKELDKPIAQAVKMIYGFATQGLNRTMNQYN